MSVLNIVTCSAAMSAVALALMLTDALALRRRWAATRALRRAWLVVVIGFILPMRPDLSGLAAHTPLAAPMDALSAQLSEALSALPAFTAPPVSASAALTASAPAAHAAPALPQWQPDWQLIALAVYIAGVALTLGLELWRHWRFKRTVLRWSRPADAEARALSRARVVASRAVDSPLLIGVIRPVIALPERALPSDELRAMIAHEECHRLNHDILIQYALLLARALNWFNPLMPLISLELTLKCEQLCDEQALNNCRLDRRTYIGAILAASAARRAPLTTGFSGGKHLMKRRLTALYSRAVPRAGTLVLVVALMLTIFAPSLTALAVADTAASSLHQPQPTDASNLSQPQPTDASNLPQPQPTLSGSDSPAEVLSDVLTVTLTQAGGDPMASAQLIIATGDAFNEVLNALDTYGVLETAYREENLSFDEIVDEYMADYPGVASEALFAIVQGAPETGLATRARLMLASGELFPEIYAQLSLGQYDARSALCACLAYNVAKDTGRISDVISELDTATRAEAQTALDAWSAAVGTDMFGASSAQPQPTDASADAQPLPTEPADAPIPQHSALALSGGDSPSEVLSDAIAITIARPHDDLTAAHLVLASGDAIDAILNSLDAYGVLETAYREENLSFDEIVDEYMADYPGVANEALFELVASAPETGFATRAQLMLASGELYPEVCVRLGQGKYESLDIVCACMAYNVATCEGRIAEITARLDAQTRAQALNALTEWIAATGTEHLFGSLDGIRAEIEAQLSADEAA